MPIANVIRIMRKILPPHAKISDDAKETIQECVSEYISFITGEANERCQREQRKTITAEDVLWAMKVKHLGRERLSMGHQRWVRHRKLLGLDQQFHIGHLPNGFFGAAAAMGGYMRDGAHAPANASSSQGGFTNADQPNGQYK
ncbi:Nuclear transcription factor Y subunit B [Quillaja saponaria]|uniref:Nuclear transcription factor Y subunit B n=1 Tax=Quillaja saponaria TaxID=32244 RepID=A0AAD7PUL4_QUISA|nr:Nuclear transcription factor Y subunit B [Quillaja saponaria]